MSTQSTRRTIIAKMQAVLRARENRGVGTGLERAIQTQNKTVSVSGMESNGGLRASGSTNTPTLSGNAANAALASLVRGNNVSLI